MAVDDFWGGGGGQGTTATLVAMALVYNLLRKWYIGKLTERLAAMGLTYHDTIAETGVYEQAIHRLPAAMQEERAVRGCVVLLPVPLLGGGE